MKNTTDPTLARARARALARFRAEERQVESARKLRVFVRLVVAEVRNTRKGS